ncbi:hypothetical protein K504DRAFT_458104 [Pleomassaria siparia CBS 279.74]|uniref:DUF202 domain-containing protein n=1 Tax=Pleomassaria siparia CBS 279.74 TaxID=1314801 RepID=A0A6G1K5F8_9PLEO|nr:hypothetical protein K504DRAFT_458104 [Pleomassaria siparia CBS 279.74]
MTDHDPPPPQVPMLQLPAPTLYFSGSEPHVDSDEFRQRDKHRTSRELEPIYEHGDSQRPPSKQHLSPNASQPRRSLSIRPRAASPRSSSYRSGGSRPCPSEISTAPDNDGPDGQDLSRYRLRRQTPHWYDPVTKFWVTQVSVTIDEGQHRDHLALERTFLAYLRTSLALAMSGVIIEQLFRLQHIQNPNLNLGFFVLGTPLAAIFIGLGMIVLLIGAFRFWRQQNAIVRGKVHAGGWEITSIMVFSIIVSAILVVFLLGIG